MWNGMFSPNLRKSIGTVRFVPLSQMTARDWRWLEFENTRTVAQNRIAQMIMSGRLRGFFQVMITEKAAKNEYFWPATDAMREAFETTDDTSFFRHTPETFTESDALETLESLRADMFALPTWAVLAIIRVLHQISESEENQEEYDSIGEEYLAEMYPDDISLLLSILMMWEMSLEEAEAILDDLPESDEADVARDWINDQVALIEAGRRALAAGRGI